MRAVITGGTGFLGAHLCDRFVSGGLGGMGLDNMITSGESNVSHLERNPRFRVERADVTEHIEVAGPVDYVLHFASPASPFDYLKFPIETMKVGSVGTHHALGLALAKK